MRQLLPEPHDDVDPDVVYTSDPRPRPADRPWVLLNMVASVDGATAVEGRSGGLGGPADRAVFLILRSLADAILVGGATVRAEHYGPPRTSAEHQQARRGRGQAPFPRIAIVTGRLDLDLTAPLFTESPSRPIVITASSAPAERCEQVEQVADVIVAGDDRVDLTLALSALGQLRNRGGPTGEGDGGAGRDEGAIDTVLCEGGPTINAQLLAADLIDEVAVTTGPLLVGGTSKRMIAGPVPPTPARLELARVLTDDDVLLMRYLRRP